MCPASTMPTASAGRSWTKVALVRHTSGARPVNHISTPVPVITSVAPAIHAAYGFCPALNNTG